MRANPTTTAELSGMRQRVTAALAGWGPQLMTLALTWFLISLGQGLFGAVTTNYFVNDLGLSGKQVLWMTGIREIPGLSLMLIAALIMHLPLSLRAGASLVVMGIGFALYAVVHSFAALAAVVVFASIGFHNWLPLSSSLGLALSKREESGRTLGTLSAVGAFASIVGMGIAALLATHLPLSRFFVVGGACVVAGGLLVLRIPKHVGRENQQQPRMLLKRRYWLYYVLTLFEGSRMQVFGAFGTLVLVQDYGLSATQISLLLVTSAVVNLLFARRLGHALDVVGERITLAVSYVLLALCFIGYATVHNALFLGAMLVGINLLVTLSIGLSTYVSRIAPPEELTPTLSAGVSVNHISSVTMALLAGSLLAIVGYEALCYGAAAIILLSVPFALMIRVPKPPAVRASGA
jgi:predicted MFS family arabinose efflux permease